MTPISMFEMLPSKPKAQPMLIWLQTELRHPWLLVVLLPNSPPLPPPPPMLTWLQNDPRQPWLLVVLLPKIGLLLGLKPPPPGLKPAPATRPNPKPRPPLLPNLFPLPGPLGAPLPAEKPNWGALRRQLKKNITNRIVM